MENALVVRGEQVLSKEALRFRDEFVRHKISGYRRRPGPIWAKHSRAHHRGKARAWSELGVSARRW
jgi:hypothetical protein